MKGVISQCRLLVDAYDFGPAIAEIVLSFPMPILDIELTQDTFTLIIKKRNTPYFVEIESITASDNNIFLKLMCHPEKFHLSPFIYDHITHHDRFAEKIDMLVYINKPFALGDFVYQDTLEIMETIIDVPPLKGFHYLKFDYDSRLSLPFGLFTPKSSSMKLPLVIWLHGAKEGGDDPRIPILGNPISYLTNTNVQTRFGGFYLLVPQAKTMWMDDGNGLYTVTGRSIYTNALKELIVSVLSDNPEIDCSRVYLGGCSNGGFMTIKLLAEYPELFAAAFPASEACLDSWLDENDINNLKKVPTWFFACEADAVVPLDLCSRKTHQRLIEAGSEQSLLTVVDQVRDKHNIYFESDGSPYIYDGHWAWLEPLNDYRNSDGTTFFDWLFSKVKQ
ncbi:MAG: hypothetical protein PHI01_03330 [Candidatus Izemoplasmatales bacterium]|nr:hypothetical protein [Candidatus Izemoplasmatales bacterium]